MDLTDARTVPTAPLMIVGLVGGFLTAQRSGIRPLGGVVMAAAGGLAGRTWLAKTDPATTAALTALYVGGMGVSHPLAKKVGVWPSVLGVTAVSAAAAYLLSDRC